MIPQHASLHATVLVLLAACGSSGSDAASSPDTGDVEHDASTSSDGSDGTSGSNEVVGQFAIRLVPPTPATDTTEAVPGFTSLNGKVYDGPMPAEIAWEESASAEGCRLLEPRVPFCDPACGLEVCVDENTCRPNPSVRSVGAVHVSGVRTDAGADEFDVSPIAGSYVNPASARLPYPAFDEGDVIRLETSGGDFEPFTLETNGIAPLEISADSALSLADGESVKLVWTPPKTPSESHVMVKLDISHHGGTKGKIECDVEDDGELTIAAELVSQLVGLGVAGFPSIVVTRSAVGSTRIAPGRVELSVESTVELGVEVPGLSSCTSNDQCSSGQTCQADLTCK